MSSYVLGFQDIDKTKLMLVGGKGANLGELFKIACTKLYYFGNGSGANGCRRYDSALSRSN